MKKYRRFCSSVALAALLASSSSLNLAAAHTGGASLPQDKQEQKDDAPKTQTPAPAKRTADRLEPDDTNRQPADVPVETQANRREQLSEEEAAVVPYYNNFMSSYRLGPEDVISIRVFDQDRYSMGNVTVPPDGRISYWFVPDGLMVTGKTTKQVADEITKHLDEYLREPKVNVNLEKAMSARFGVIGDVAQPGIRIMTRRMTVYEALLEAGGVLPTGDKKKVMVLRQQASGSMQQIHVDIAAIEKGKALNNQFLAPGDQVVVPGNRLKKVQAIMNLLPILSFARIFTGGF
ncbi:MAG TPA: polysaccharide biosynthesis/export family protein [Pyrinomonadaceae bacterium]|jgi:protein involved in polysaccharide export with SLBB domain|nr:polysaccharide biosynthesis/export family protein [Pyrinomonadaceae bacterium]